MSKSFLLHESENLDVRLEYDNDYFILHLPKLLRLTPDTYKKLVMLLEDLDDFRKTMGYPFIVAGVHPDDTKMKRLLAKLGFQWEADSNGVSVHTYRSTTGSTAGRTNERGAA